MHEWQKPLMFAYREGVTGVVLAIVICRAGTISEVYRSCYVQTISERWCRVFNATFWDLTSLTMTHSPLAGIRYWLCDLHIYIHGITWLHVFVIG